MLKHMLEGHEGEAGEVEKQVETLFGILHGTIRVVVGFVAMMLVLRNIGIDIAPILAGAGVVGLAVGFGAQELVRDVISGFFMLLENHIRTGDVVQVNGTSGLVERVGLRAIVLRDVTGTVHVFQNGKVSTLANMTKGWSAAVFDVGVAYESNLDLVIQTMNEVAEGMLADPTSGPLILEPMEIFGVEAFGNSEITIKARLKTKPSQQWLIAREYRKRLKLAFDRVGIETPSPQRTVWLKESPKALPDSRLASSQHGSEDTE
jgi:moderate conductance mechanosensitive channel